MRFRRGGAGEKVTIDGSGHVVWRGDLERWSGEVVRRGGHERLSGEVVRRGGPETWSGW